MKDINFEVFATISTDNAKVFVDTYLPAALKIEKQTGLNHIVILAQAALESAWGLKAVCFNFFGIKWTGKGDKQLITTTEILFSENAKFPEIISKTKRPDGKYTYKVRDYFRKYNNAEESFADHALFFQENKRYADAWKVRADTNLFIDAIAKAGYATAPDYAAQMKAVVKSVNKRL